MIKTLTRLKIVFLQFSFRPNKFYEFIQNKFSHPLVSIKREKMTINSMQCILNAIANSIVSYPSCAFWGCALSTLVMFLVSVTANSLYSNGFFGNISVFGIVYLMEKERTVKHFQMVSLISSSFIIILNYYMNSYYKISHRNSEKSMKQKLNIFLYALHITSVLYILLFGLACFLPDDHKYTKSLCFSLFFFTHPFLHIIPKCIVRLKHPTRAIPGYSLINFELVASIVAFPLYMLNKYTNTPFSFTARVASSLYTVCYLLNGLSFVFDAITVLGHRFIRFHQYLSPENSSRKVSVHV